MAEVKLAENVSTGGACSTNPVLFGYSPPFVEKEYFSQATCSPLFPRQCANKLEVQHLHSGVCLS